MNAHRLFTVLALSSLPWALASGSASAAGFALQNQNGAGTGYAYAGSAAVAEDASTVFFNPAGMTYLAPSYHLSGSLTALDRSLRFSDRGSTRLLGALPLGDRGGQAGGTSWVPAAYGVMSPTPDLRIGVGVSPTFGNETEWTRDFIGRYQGIYSEIQAINVNPSVAYRVNERVSLGAGVNFVRFEADLQQMGLNGRVKLSGDDTAVGYNLGAMFQLTPATRIGVAYRSTVSLRVKGKVEESAGGPDQRAAVSIKLPDTLSLAVVHAVNDRLQLQADYTWTGWSSLPGLEVRDRGTGALISEERLGFRDSYRVGVGAQYQYSDALRLRAGVAYDRSPVRSSSDRTVRLPDSDRTWLAIGANYAFSKQTSLDVGYARLFFSGARIDRATLNDPELQVVRGSFDTTVNIFSAQLNYSF